MSIAAESAPEPESKGGSRYIGIFIFLLVVGIGGYFGYHALLKSRLYQTTDNAQVEADVIPISAEVPARIKRVLVTDNQLVKKGDVLVELDPTDYLVKVEQAEKAIKAIEQRRRAAQAQLQLTRQNGDAVMIQGQSGVEVAQAGVVTSQSGVQTAQERLGQAQAAVTVARANVARSRTSVDVARAEVQRLDTDVQRYRTLYAQEEVSRQQFDAVQTSARQAHSRLEAAQREVQGAQAQVVEAQAGVSQAAQSIQQSQSQVQEARARVDEAEGRLLSAKTAPEQIDVAAAQVKVVQADLDQARASLKLAQKELERTRIVAPVAGVVSKRSAQEGGYVQKGSPLVALVGSQKLWVVANFKETQMTHISTGLEVEISVDSYPNKTFKGRIDSVQAGTGARFSLLPPENAAGSFVKVVQRIPVKITLDENSFEATPLRPGMSVEARVRLP